MEWRVVVSSPLVSSPLSYVTVLYIILRTAVRWSIQNAVPSSPRREERNGRGRNVYRNTRVVVVVGAMADSRIIVVGAREVQTLTKKADVRKRLQDDIAWIAFLFLVFLIGALVLPVQDIQDIERCFFSGFLSKRFPVSDQINTTHINFFEVRNKDNAFRFVEKILVPALFYTVNNATIKNPYVRTNVGLWGIRFRAQNVESLGSNFYSESQKTMTSFLNSSAPIYQTYDESRLEVAAYGPEITMGTYTGSTGVTTTVRSPQFLYRSQADTRTPRYTTYDSLTYDGSGYVSDILYGTDSADVYSAISTLRQYFLNTDCRSFNVLTLFYNPSYNRFVYLRLIFEIRATGVVKSTHQIRSAVLYRNDESSEQMILGIQAFILVAVLLVICRSFYQLIRIAAKITIFDLSLVFWYSLDIFLGIIAVYKFWSTTVELNYRIERSPMTSALLDGTVIWNFEDLCIETSNILKIDALLLFLYSLVIVRIASNLSFFAYFYRGVKRLRPAFVGFVAIGFGSCLLLALATYAALGFYEKRVTTFRSALIEVFFSMAVGRVSNEFVARNGEWDTPMLSINIVAVVVVYFMRALWIATIVYTWWAVSPDHARDQLGRIGTFKTIKKNISQRVNRFSEGWGAYCARRLRTLSRKFAFGQQEDLATFDPTMPTHSQMNIAFDRWKKCSNQLIRFPFLTQSQLAAYIRDDENLHSLLEPRGGVRWSATRKFLGLSDQETATLSPLEIRALVEKARKRLHIRTSEVIARRLFEKWYGLWTPDGYARAKYSREKGEIEGSRNGAVRPSIDDFQVVTATSSLKNLSDEYDRKISMLRRELSMIRKRQESLLHATEALCDGVDAATRQIDSDELVDPEGPSKRKAGGS